jgi:hypothetical protein
MLPPNLPDCWWQIPPFGKDFCVARLFKIAEIMKLCGFLKSGTALEWEEAGLGP